MNSFAAKWDPRVALKLALQQLNVDEAVAAQCLLKEELCADLSTVVYVL